jgi:hypothetical protein
LSFLENLEESMFHDSEGNGEIVDNKLVDRQDMLTSEDVEKYSERLRYMEENGI